MPTEDDLLLLARLGEELAADAMEMDDEEAFSSAPAEELGQLRDRLMNAAKVGGRRRLASARQAFEKAQSAERKRTRNDLPSVEKRRRVQAFLASGKGEQLTLRLRDAKGASDDDVDSLYDDLIALGLDLDTDDDS